MSTEEEINNLALLKTLTSGVTEEFCKMAIQSLKEEINPKTFISASNKLNVRPIEVENATHAILSVYMKCSEKNGTKDDLCTLLEQVELEQDVLTVFCKVYETNKEFLREQRDLLAMKIPEYANLDWRLDVLTKTRALNNIAEPVLTMQLQLKNNGVDKNNETLQFQIDPTNLVNMTSSLEDALHKARSYHVRKLQKVKNK